MLYFATRLLSQVPPIGTDVYTTLEAQGITVSGGRIAGVGVGGYLLGGGYSYLSSEVSTSLYTNAQTRVLTLLWKSRVCRWTT